MAAAAHQAVAPVQAKPALAAGTQVPRPVPEHPPGAAGAIGGTVFALLLVLGLIFALAWLARRLPNLAGGTGHPALRVIASLPLGARERVVVVDVGGTQLLLGVGASGTRTLHRLERPLPVPEPQRPSPFAQLLAQHFGKKP